MTWKDRAEPVTQDTSATPDWRSRAEPATPSDDSGDYWGDVKKNAIEGVKQWPGAAKQLFSAAETPNIFNAGKSITQMSNGVPFQQTPTGQSVDALKKVAMGIPQGVWQTAKDAGAAAVAPLQMATGTPARSTILGRNFRQRPLSTAANVATVGMAAKSLFGGAEGAATEAGASTPDTVAQSAGSDLPVVQQGAKTGDPHAVFIGNDNFGPGGTPRSLYNVFGDPNHPTIQQRGWGSTISAEDAQKANIPITGKSPNAQGQPISPPQTSGASSQASAPNYLETTGAQGLYEKTGIRGMTIEKMTPWGGNPATVGADFIKKLESQGVLDASTRGGVLDKVQNFYNSAGSKVGAARDAIKAESSKYAGVNDPTVIPADEALQPLADQMQKYKSGALSQTKSIGRTFKSMYDFLLNKAQAQGGDLSLEDIKGGLDEVGPLTHVGNDIQQEAMARLYGSLADTQDHMVKNIAAQAKNPALRDNLLKANADFSQIARVIHDVRRGAAMEITSQPNMGNILHQIIEAVKSSTPVSKGIMKAGSMFKKKP